MTAGEFIFSVAPIIILIIGWIIPCVIISVLLTRNKNISLTIKIAWFFGVVITNYLGLFAYLIYYKK